MQDAGILFFYFVFNFKSEAILFLEGHYLSHIDNGSLMLLDQLHSVFNSYLVWT